MEFYLNEGKTSDPSDAIHLSDQTFRRLLKFYNTFAFPIYDIPWVTASPSSDSESSPRLHHSSYLVILLITSSILPGPTFPIVVFSSNLSKRFPHCRLPSRASIDRGRVKAPVVGSFHTSRRTTVLRFSVATSARLHTSECLFRFYIYARNI
jgi:hypothetical protein